jgi:hypothetical protein
MMDGIATIDRVLAVAPSFPIRDPQYGNAADGVDREAGRQSPVGAIDERVGDGRKVRDQEQCPCRA